MSEKVEGDFITLSCQLTNARDEAGLGKAVGEFQSLYSKIKASAVEDTVTLKSFKPMPNKKQLSSAVDRLKSQYPVVWVSCVNDGACDSVSFIASSKDQCQSAVASFKLIMDGILH